MDQGIDGALMLEHVTLVSEEVVPYVLQWPIAGDDQEPAECTVLVTMRRANGLLLAMPIGFLPAELLEAGQHGAAEAVFGPSTSLIVPSMLAEGGVLSQTGEDVAVLVVDCAESVLNYIREFEAGEEQVFNFDVDSPFAFPAPDALLAHARDWLVSVSKEMAAFYTPAELPDGEGVASSQSTPRRRAPKASLPQRKATATGDGAKTKRVTTASLSAQLEGVVAALPALTEKLEALTMRQTSLEHQLPGLGRSTPATLAQPLGGSLDLPRPQLGPLARTLQSPPRTLHQPIPGTLASGAVGPRQAELQALAEEKVVLSTGSVPRDDALAQAVFAQSQALTHLVAQIASAQGDPMSDLTSGTSAGSKGAAGRAKLQAELAAQKGTFFKAVVQSMARRMSPTASTEGSYQELLDKGISGVRYLERFGGYSRQRELGQLQFQVMTALDFMMAGRTEAAMDTIALLAVSIEQAALDQGRMDLATLLCLQEDPPASIFTNRALSSTSRARSFAPLADQRWVTVALAFLKEMEVISAKRSEMAGAPNFPSRDFARSTSSKAKRKVQGHSKEEGKPEMASSTRRGRSMTSSVSEGPESNPLDATIDFDTWVLCLPRWMRRWPWALKVEVGQACETTLHAHLGLLPELHVPWQGSNFIRTQEVPQQSSDEMLCSTSGTCRCVWS